MADFAKDFIEGFQQGQQIKKQKETSEQEAEDRKIKKQMLDLQMKELKLKDALAQRQVQGMTPGQHQTDPSLDTNIQSLLMNIRGTGKPVAAQPMPIPVGLEQGAPSVTPPPSAPAQITHAPFPDIESPYGMVPGTNREIEQERGIADLLRQHTMEAQKAGMVATAQKQAEAPFAPPRNIDPLSTEGADTRIRIDNATRVPPSQPSAVSEYLFYVDQEIKAGRTPLSFDAYQGRDANRRAQRPSTSSEPLVQTLDDQGNLVWTPRSQAGGLKAPPTRLAPGEQPPSPYSQERARRVVADVDSLKSKVNRASVGFGSLLSVIPETQAREFKAQLDSLKANIAFNELNAMREASKTGGALGQVSVRELELLESALGALDTGQSPSEFTSQLDKIKASIERWQAAAASNQTRTPPPTVGVLDFDGIRFPTQQALDEYKRRTGQ